MSLVYRAKVVTTNYDDLMNVKNLIKEICQILDMSSSDSTAAQVAQIKTLGSKVLNALSVNNFPIGKTLTKT